MRKTKGKVLAAVLVASVLCAGTVTVQAETISRSIGGYGFTATTEVTSTTAMARTLAGGPYLYVSVSAEYNYINLDTYETAREYGDDQGIMGARVDFTTDSDYRYRTIDVKASHTAEAENGEFWSGSTDESYIQ